MKQALFAAAALAALTATASAQDAAPYSWTGIYLGVNGGAGYFEGETTDYQGYFLSTAGSATLGVDGVGGFFGGTAGANFQIGQMVLGIEGDLQWASFDESRKWNLGFYVNEASWDWFGTIRGRAGVALDRAMVYATGGAAFASVNHRYGSTATPDFIVSYDDVEWGFAVGGGVEYALTDHISAKAEYLYIDIPTVTVEDTFAGIYDFNSSSQIVRGGLSYKF